MYKKGHRPHNKGDTYVRANYRNKPSFKKEALEHLKQKYPDYEFHEKKEMTYQSSNPFRIHITPHDLSTSKNHLKSDRIDLF